MSNVNTKPKAKVTKTSAPGATSSSKKLKNLFIVESPAKIKTITKHITKIATTLGDKDLANFEIIASYGHFRDLSMSKGKDYVVNGITNNYEPEYIDSEMDLKKKVIANLKYKCKNSEIVWLAADLDREGEAIAWHVQELIGEHNYRRIAFNAITYDEILKAVQNYRQVDMNLVNAQQSRRIFDRLIGFKLTEFLWKQFQYNKNSTLSAGRVQSVALRMIVDKMKKINDYTSESLWHGLGSFMIKGYPQPLNDCKLFYKNGKKYDLTEYTSREQVEKFWHEMNYKFVIDSYKISVSKDYPGKPFITSTLQQAAYTRFGFKLETTMKTAQELYEAGKITYMRTDSANYSDAFKQTGKDFILKHFGDDYLNMKAVMPTEDQKKEKDAKAKAKAKAKTKAKTNDSKKDTKNEFAQEAHEAIRPTDIDFHYDKLDMSDQCKKLYKLIWKHTTASLMTPAEYDVFDIYIVTTDSKFVFKGTVKGLKFKGYKILDGEVSGKTKTNAKNTSADADTHAPVLGDDGEEIEEVPDTSINIKQLTKLIESCQSDESKIKCTMIVLKNHWTTPPMHYTMPSIVQDIEKNGIGRPSTYQSIIQKLFERNYVVESHLQGVDKKYIDYIWKCDDPKCVDKNINNKPLYQRKKSIIPTEIGIKVVEYLTNNYKDVMDISFTAQMEQNLDNMAKGEIEYKEFVKMFGNNFMEVHKTVLVNNKQEGGDKESVKTQNKQFQLGNMTCIVFRDKYKNESIRYEKKGEPQYLNLTNYFNYARKSIASITENEIKLLMKLPTYIQDEKQMMYGRYGLYIVEDNGKKYPFPKKQLSQLIEDLYGPDSVTLELTDAELFDKQLKTKDKDA
jgi:DNA topoisomerase-1